MTFLPQPYPALRPRQGAQTSRIGPASPFKPLYCYRKHCRKSSLNARFFNKPPFQSVLGSQPRNDGPCLGWQPHGSGKNRPARAPCRPALPKAWALRTHTPCRRRETRPRICAPLARCIRGIPTINDENKPRFQPFQAQDLDDPEEQAERRNRTMEQMMATSTQQQGGEAQPQSQQQGQSTAQPQQAGASKPQPKPIIRDWAAI